ncbi:MAG: ABC transporter ATP-binding protein [Candidatus Merdivicinus sp.]|jgi:iron complex transport system ATP-binding protein
MMGLSVENLSVSLTGKIILRNVSFSLPETGLFFLLGPNGSGKSTLLRALCGLVPAQKGTISWKNQSILGLLPRELSKQIGYLPQNIQSVEMTAEEFAMLGAAPYLKWGEVPGETYRNSARNALETLGISHLAERPMDQMSGGERQMAALARAMVQNASLLLLDEPTASLDVKRQQDFLKILQKAVIAGGKCALLSVHDPNLALTYGDGVLILRDGETKFLPASQNLGETLCQQLKPLYGENFTLSADGYFYWKTERRL